MKGDEADNLIYYPDLRCIKADGADILIY